MAKNEVELWKSTEPTPRLFAAVRFPERIEHLPIESKQFKQHLSYLYYRSTGKAIGPESVSQCVTTLAGTAQYDSPSHEVWLRVGTHEEKLYLNLADDKGTVIEIDADGWRVAKHVPIRFLRASGKPLPMPERGGNLRHLNRFLNLDSDREETNLMFIAAFLVQTLRSGFPHPILLLMGEAGSGKSTKIKMLKALVDPGLAEGRGAPKSEEDLVITARSNHVVTSDNLSGMSPEMADAFCRLATAGGIGKRQLYTDGDEFVLEVRRPVILAGINPPTTRQDFLDRAIALTLNPIGEGARRGEQSLLKEFNAECPRLLGSLLDGAVYALRNPIAPPKALPRMADFAMWAASALPAWEWDSDYFLSKYRELRKETLGDAADKVTLLSAIRDFVLGLPRKDAYGKSIVRAFSGRAKLLLEELERLDQVKVVDRDWKKENSWPTGPQFLSGRIKLGASGLRALGLGVEPEAGTSSNKKIRLWFVEDGTPNWKQVEGETQEKQLKLDTKQREFAEAQDMAF